MTVHANQYRRRFTVSEKVVPDLEKYPFINHLGGGQLEVDTHGLLNAFIAQETTILTTLTEAVKALDDRASQVEKNLPEGAQILPGTLDEADRAGYIDGLRAGARHLSLRLGALLNPDTRSEGEAV